MKVIITEENDKVSDNVIEWLYASKKNVTRINYESTIQSLSLSITSCERPVINFDGNSSEELTTIWHRRARLNLLPAAASKSPVITDLIRDEKTVNTFIEFRLRNSIKYVGSYFQEVDNNKLEDLAAAANVGLLIPNTLITNQKRKLLDFLKEHNQIICKQINGTYQFESATDQLKSHGTRLLSENDLINIPESFALSLFQSYVPKEVEIRVYFFQDKFFPMAIFSQNDAQTKVDYRNYNTEKPNRYVPFKLPETIHKKLTEFNQARNYTTGSFDLILTSQGEYYFLEINPSSQFHWLSVNCNYYIEKEIAEML